MSLPEGGPRYELIGGDLYMAPAPNRFHQEISGNLEFLFRKYLECNCLGKLYDAPFDVVLGDHDVLQPDLLYVSRGRASILTEHGAEGAPDLVVEILSPGSARRDEQVKRAVYARVGVGELWIIDPHSRRARVYRFSESADAPVAEVSEGDIVRTPLLPGLEVRLEDVFRS